MRYRRFMRLTKSIELKLNYLPTNPIESDIILFYPDEHKLSDSDMQKLMDKIDTQLIKRDVDSFIILIQSYMTEKGFRANNVYTKALIEKSYFYQILKGTYLPSRDVAIRLCLAMCLNFDESKKLLNSLGYTFYEYSSRDIVITQCIKYKAGLYTTEILLDKYHETSLCNKSILS